MEFAMIAVLLIAAVTLLFCLFCSVARAVLPTIPPETIESLTAKRVLGADALARISREIDGAVLALGAARTTALALGVGICDGIVLRDFPPVWSAPVILALTALAVVVCDFAPRALDAKRAERLAPILAWIAMSVTWPIRPFSRPWGLWIGSKPPPTEDEIMRMSRLAVQAGELRPQELRWVENALRLDTVRACDLMTPRTVVYTLPADLKLSDVQQRSEHWIHSRLPVTEDRDPDRILGMVHRREVFDALVKGSRSLTLRDLMRPIDFIPDITPGDRLLDKFIKEKIHMVAVIDEYGGFEGVVTLEDVLECLLGSEIVDETDRHADLQQLARERAMQRGLPTKKESVPQPAAKL